ncbi:dermonecrotic toxin domain-containing protein [Pseudomonas poae]|nr:DUF6543 domain-containing protein [Pseudomonas poae]
MTSLSTNMPTLAVGSAARSTLSTQKSTWDVPLDDYTLKTTEDTFRESMGRDLNTGALDAAAEKLVYSVLTPEKIGAPKVQVKTFAVDGIQSKDIIFVERAPAEPNQPNVVLFVPNQTGKSFFSFDNLEQMNKWLKEIGSDPDKLEKFSAHFSEGGSPVRNARVKEVMRQFARDDVNAVVGPYANEQGNIFKRLDREANSPPPSINGLSQLQEVKQTETGRSLYSGYRPDGEKVLFELDAYGNLLGAGDKGNFYFAQSEINANRPLRPMTEKEYNIAVERQVNKNVGADDVRGLYESLLEHLEHPFQGVGEALEVFGVNASTADTVERYLDNPISALLLDLNKKNHIGKVFGLDKEHMDAILKKVGDAAQGFVPYYGQARTLGGLLAKAIRNEPLSNQETRDLADAMMLKPDSLARKNIPPLDKPSRLQSDTVKLAKPSGVEEATVKTSVPMGMRQIQYEGDTYVIANKPDAGDGVHYILRKADPLNPSELIGGKSTVKPNAEGGWTAGTKLIDDEITIKDGQLIKLGGTMENLTEISPDLYTFVDLNKRGRQVRLNIMAHGEEPGGFSLNTNTKTPTKIHYDGKPHTPQELLDSLKKKGIDPSDYDNVRLLMCYSANGKENSFAAEFSRLINKPVKGYEGTLSAYVSPEVIKEFSDKANKYVGERLGGDDQLLPVERRAVADVTNKYVQGKFATKAFKIAKKNPSWNPIEAWTFTYRPVTFASGR